MRFDEVEVLIAVTKALFFNSASKSPFTEELAIGNEFRCLSDMVI